MRKLVLVSAGLSTPSSTRRLGDALAQATYSGVSARGENLEVTVIELRELAQELALAMTDWEAETPNLDRAKQQVVSADGLIAVTPAFQGSYSGLFKMFFDTLSPKSLTDMPVLIAATGGSSRHALMLDFAMRPLFNYLHAIVVPTGIFAVAQDCEGHDHAESQRRIHTAANQLADWMVAPNDRVAGLSGIPAKTTAAPEKEDPSFTPLGKMLKVADIKG